MLRSGKCLSSQMARTREHDAFGNVCALSCGYPRLTPESDEGIRAIIVADPNRVSQQVHVCVCVCSGALTTALALRRAMIMGQVTDGDRLATPRLVDSTRGGFSDCRITAGQMALVH